MEGIWAPSRLVAIRVFEAVNSNRLEELCSYLVLALDLAVFPLLERLSYR